jgi:hypothetical protein
MAESEETSSGGRVAADNCDGLHSFTLNVSVSELHNVKGCHRAADPF